MSKPFIYLSLSKGKFAMIDVVDFEKIGHLKWHALKTSSGNFRAARTVWKRPKSKMVYLHCEIMGIKGIDHKDGDDLNCRRENMRPATQQQNLRAFQRKSAGCSSKFRGVHWYERDKKWEAQIKTNGKCFYLGRFDKEKDAARAYDKKAKELGFFKEALNFPNEV